MVLFGVPSLSTSMTILKEGFPMYGPTSDLGRFGGRELSLLTDLLIAARDQGFPMDFDTTHIIPMMNMDSGDVFFTNDDFQVAMMNGRYLEMVYFCSDCGNEGFADEIAWDRELDLCGACAKDRKGEDDEDEEEEDE